MGRLSQAGCGSGQSGLVVGDPACSRGLELKERCGPSQPRPFYHDSMIPADTDCSGQPSWCNFCSEQWDWSYSALLQKAFRLDIRKSSFSKEPLGTGTDCQGRWGGHHSWRSSRTMGMCTEGCGWWARWGGLGLGLGILKVFFSLHDSMTP